MRVEYSQFIHKVGRQTLPFCHSEGETHCKFKLHVLPEESLHSPVSAVVVVRGCFEISTSEVYERP